MRRLRRERVDRRRPAVTCSASNAESGEAAEPRPHPLEEEAARDGRLHTGVSKGMVRRLLGLIAQSSK